MKKALLIMAALVLIAGIAFADDAAGVKIGAWGRGIFVPVMGGDDLLSATHASWGWNPRVGMTITGTSPNVGFQVDFNGDGGGVGAGDQQKIWVKPISMLTVQIGNIYDDTLRGNAGDYGMWNWLRSTTMTGEDVVFERVGIANLSGQDKANFEVALAPVDGAYIFAAAKGILGKSEATKYLASLGQYGAGYTIPNIGVVRAQYIGEVDKNSLVDPFGIFNVAFKVTAVPNLTLDVGGKVPTDAKAAGVTAIAACAAKYSMDALTLNAMGSFIIFESDTADMLDLIDYSTIGIEAGIGASYNLGNNLAVEGEFRYQNDSSTIYGAMKAAVTSGTLDMSQVYEDGVISGMLGLTMGFSNGLIGAGIEITSGNFVGASSLDIAKSAQNDIVWAIPVRLEYWF